MLSPLSGPEGEEVSIDLGPVLLGDQVRQTFRLANRGESSLRVTAEKPSSAGTGLMLDSGLVPLTVPAGDEAKLVVVFVPPVAGPVSVDLVLELENATVPQVVLHLTGKGVDGKCLVEPASVDFGTVPTAILQTKAVRISNGSELDWSVGVGELEGDGVFSLKSEPGTLKVPAGGSVAVTVRLAAMEPGTFSGRLPLSGKAKCIAQKIPLSAVAVEETLTVAPGTLEFGGVQVGSTGSRSVTVRNLGGSNVTLTGLAVTSANAGFALAASATGPVVVAKGSQVEIGVVFKPLKLGEDSGELTATSDDLKTTQIKVKLQGNGVE